MPPRARPTRTKPVEPPGTVLQRLYLDPLGMNVTDTAKLLGVSRVTLSRIVHGHAAITALMAIRLSLAFDAPAEFWMRAQAAWDLYQAREEAEGLKIQRVA